jgi:hypothetical protein
MFWTGLFGKENRKRLFIGMQIILHGAAGLWRQFEDIGHKVGEVRKEHERERK